MIKYLDYKFTSIKVLYRTLPLYHKGRRSFVNYKFQLFQTLVIISGLIYGLFQLKKIASVKSIFTFQQPYAKVKDNTEMAYIDINQDNMIPIELAIGCEQNDVCTKIF